MITIADIKELLENKEWNDEKSPWRFVHVEEYRRDAKHILDEGQFGGQFPYEVKNQFHLRVSVSKNPDGAGKVILFSYTWEGDDHGQLLKRLLTDLFLSGIAHSFMIKEK